jgi:hypothetical protein
MSLEKIDEILLVATNCESNEKDEDGERYYDVDVDTNFGELNCVAQLTDEEAKMLEYNIGNGEEYMRNHCCGGNHDQCCFCSSETIVSSISLCSIKKKLDHNYIIEEILDVIKNGDFVHHTSSGDEDEDEND